MLRKQIIWYLAVKKLANIFLLINNEMIARTYETQFQYSIIQANLKWNTHNVQLKNKISKSMNY